MKGLIHRINEFVEKYFRSPCSSFRQINVFFCPKVVVFGDSTSAERRNRGLKRIYCERVKEILKSRGIKLRMINASQGGSHTGRLSDNAASPVDHALDRFEKKVRRHKPVIVILWFGLNDSWVDGDDRNGPSRIPLPSYIANLKEMTNKLLRNGAKVILVTPNKLGSLYPEWRNQRLFKYAEAVRKISESSQTEIFDVWNFFETYTETSGNEVDDLLLDSMHPNDLGHRFIAEALADAIEHLWSNQSRGFT